MREFDMEQLQHYNLIVKAACCHYDLKKGDYDLLLYLNPIKYFTIPDFKNGMFIMSWDKDRFYRLQQEGWIKKIFDGRGTGNHNKYALTQKAKLMINKVSKWICGNDIPEIRSPKGYAQKVLNTSIKRFNNIKYGNERIHS